MSEWLYEDGIGEARAALVENDCIVEALIEVEGTGPRAGTVVEGRQTAIAIPAQRGFVTLADGSEVLVEPLLRAWTQGALVRVEVTREAIPERDRAKRAKGRPAPDTALADGPGLLARITATGIPVRTLALHEPDVLEAAGWSELIESVQTGLWSFAGGELRISPTPAMTLIDVDGHLEPAGLALAAATAAGRAIRAFGIAGSIGVDFPTLGGKEARTAVAAAFDAALPPPFERTAVNGFGFMQVIRPRTRASLIEHVQGDPDGHAARALLRRVGREGRTGATTLVAHPRVTAVLDAHPDWLDRLARLLGGPIGLRSQATTPMSGGYAERA
ncbi:ribonuclease [Sphingomonas sp. SUN039]|uniref:ribonuclease n=1 Tax=Sphingomonas sp. SUN039 TaxID=2937787 RepID=UPI002164AA7B|nr:ribonuclease [Sphingomonas sp. SUN039]UVO55254.1 ribonuclease [Sphingomonas sp. SUN039]